MYQLNDKIAMTQLSNKYIAFFLRVSISVIFCLTILSSYAQDKEKIYMSMGYKQVVNEYRLVEVTIRTRVDGKFKPIQDAPIEIFMETEDDEIFIGNVDHWDSTREGILIRSGNVGIGLTTPSEAIAAAMDSGRTRPMLLPGSSCVRTRST